MQKAVFLVFAWTLPAAIAGMLGWNGIWGTGSAFVDFLIPVPVAGGVLHVPSFMLLVFIVFALDQWPGGWRCAVPAIAFALFLGALAMQVDSERLGNWLLTDYEPYGSPVRFDENPLYLFFASDAFCALLYAHLSGSRSPAGLWAGACVLPVVLIGSQIAGLASGGLRFDIGASVPKDRSSLVSLVYVSGAYDEQAFSAWYAELDHHASPWHSPNFEQSAIYFTNSMDLVKLGPFDRLEEGRIVATACLYESDLSVNWHAGYVDCFLGRPTVESQLASFGEAMPESYDRRARYWLSTWRLCRDWQPRDDVERWMDIRLEDQCGTFWRTALSSAAELTQSLGADVAESRAIAEALESVRAANPLD